MKAISITLLLFFILNACSNHKNKIDYNPDDPCIIVGQIINKDIYNHINEIHLRLKDFNMGYTEYKCLIDTNGKFRFEFYPKIKREIELTSIEDVIVAGPGDSIYVEKDFEDMGKTIFKGDHILINANISRFRKWYSSSYHPDGKMEAKEFKIKCDNTKNSAYKTLEKYKRRYKTDEEFEEWVNLTIELDYYKAFVDQAAFRQQLMGPNILVALNNYYKINSLEKRINNMMNKSFLMNVYYNLGHTFVHHKLMRYQIKQMLTQKQLENNIPIDYMIENTDKSLLGQIQLLEFIQLAKKWNQLNLSSIQKQQVKEKITHPCFKESI